MVTLTQPIHRVPPRPVHGFWPLSHGLQGGAPSPRCPSRAAPGSGPHGAPAPGIVTCGIPRPRGDSEPLAGLGWGIPRQRNQTAGEERAVPSGQWWCLTSLFTTAHTAAVHFGRSPLPGCVVSSECSLQAGTGTSEPCVCEGAAFIAAGGSEVNSSIVAKVCSGTATPAAAPGGLAASRAAGVEGRGALGEGGAHDDPSTSSSLDRRRQVCMPGEEEASSPPPLYTAAVFLRPHLPLPLPFSSHPSPSPQDFIAAPGSPRELPSVPEQRRGQRAPGAATRGHCGQPRAPLLLPIDLFKARSAFLIIHHFLPGATYS